MRDERPEIEGLRGVAVLSLLAVHVAPALSRGGSIGIDIFFVVSGYLLTFACWRHLDRGGRWDAFLTRRLLRVVPPLVVVLATCLALATLFTLPTDLASLGRSMAWGAALLTNVDAWRRDVPIDLAQALDPLAHLWQVAAIVQTCWLLTLLSWCLRSRPRTMWHVAIASGVASLAFAVFSDAHAPQGSYYLLAGRWWEVMAGAMLAMGANRNTGDAGESPERGKSPGATAAALQAAILPHLGWLGVACLVVATLLAQDTTLFPGSWAIWPVAGTVCLLAAGPWNPVNRHLLAHPMLRFYGRVGFPLYLWHWPVLCFPLLLGVPLSIEVRVLILLAAVVLAALTHELVEKPFAEMRTTRRLSLQLLAALVATAVLGFFVTATDGLRFTFPADLQSGTARSLVSPH